MATNLKLWQRGSSDSGVSRISCIRDGEMIHTVDIFSERVELSDNLLSLLRGVNFS